MVRSYDCDTGCQRYTGNGMSYLSLHAFSSSQYLFIRDIDIEPGIKEARFVCPDGEYAMQFLLEKCMKQFPDVEKIYIGLGVNSLHFSNFMFPNVKYVESDSKSFLSGQMLVSTSSSLYNVFCRKPEDVIDLNKVMFIEDKAFAGCMSTNIINTDNVRLVDSRAFDGSAVSMLDCKNGVVMVGNNIIIDVNEDADEIVLPRDCVVSHAIEKRHLKKAVIKDMKMLSDLQLNADTIVIDDDNERVKASLAKYGLAYAKTIELTERTRSIGYTDIDGIVYSADKKALIVCPGGRTKPVNIPEGTETISSFAFAESMIESVYAEIAKRMVAILLFLQRLHHILGIDPDQPCLLDIPFQHVDVAFRHFSPLASRALLQLQHPVASTQLAFFRHHKVIRLFQSPGFGHLFRQGFILGIRIEIMRKADTILIGYACINMAHVSPLTVPSIGFGVIGNLQHHIPFPCGKRTHAI